MDIRSFREQQNLTRKAFVMRVRPHLKQFTLNENLLERIETGAVRNRDREADLVAAVKAAFPAEIVPQQAVAPRRRLTEHKLLRAGAVALFVLGVFAIVVLYVVFEDHPLVAKAVRALGLLATVVSIVGFVLTLPRKGAGS